MAELLLWLCSVLLLPTIGGAFSSSRPLSSFSTPSSRIRRPPPSSYGRISTRRHVRFSFLFNNGFGRRRNTNNGAKEEERRKNETQQVVLDREESRGEEELFSAVFRKRDDQMAPRGSNLNGSLRNDTIAEYIHNRIQAQEESLRAINELHEREGIRMDDDVDDEPVPTTNKEDIDLDPNPPAASPTRSIIEAIEMLGEAPLLNLQEASSESLRSEQQETAKEVQSEDSSKIDILSPSLLVDISSNGETANQTNNDNTQQVVILNETLMRDVLELLGPMTMSDPSFAIGAGVNVTFANECTEEDVMNTTTSALPKENGKAKKKKTYNPVSILNHKFFAYNNTKAKDSAHKNGNGQQKQNQSQKKNGKDQNSKTVKGNSKSDINSFFSSNNAPIINNSNGKNGKTITIVGPNLANISSSLGVLPNEVLSSLTGNATAPPLTLESLASILTNSTLPITASSSGSSNPYYLYDPASALAFLDEQANFTKQQLEAAQKVFFDYSTNATKQLDSAQKALLEYGTKALEETAAAVTPTLPPISTGSGLSVDQLEAYLRLNGYVKAADLEGGGEGFPVAGTSQVGRGRQRVMTARSSSGFLAVGDADAKAVSPLDKGGKKGKSDPTGRVAFPQPSVLSYAKLTWGSTAASSLLGLFGGITVFPNLWLLGALFGGLYGYDVSRNVAENPPTSALAKVVIYLGRELTKKYLWVYDFCQGLWFMYKTGQLSYDYWKKYAALDQQFAIQAKMDAWNAKFQQGKINFDKWEQENEVGRKVIAGLRTFWLVEEQSKRKIGPKSRYRVVQWTYDAGRYTRKKIARLYANRGNALKEIQDLAEGMRQELIDPSQWKQSMRPRIAAGLAALTFVNLTGALFAVSPLLLGILALVLGGIVWPTWFSEWLGRLGTFFEETKAKGRGDLFRNRLVINKGNAGTPTRGTPKRSNSSSNDKPKVVSLPFMMTKQEQERYYYFRRPDGSKRWYRTGGNPWDANSNLSNIWGKKKEEEKPWWSLN